MIVSISSKVPTEDCFTDSALLLYFSESRTRSRNSTIVPFSRNCRYLCLCFIV